MTKPPAGPGWVGKRMSVLALVLPQPMAATVGARSPTGGAPTVAVLLAVLLARLLSGVELVTVAVLVRVLPTATLPLTVAVRVRVWLAPAARVPRVVKKVVPEPVPSLAETKVSPAGSVSVTTTF